MRLAPLLLAMLAGCTAAVPPARTPDPFASTQPVVPAPIVWALNDDLENRKAWWAERTEPGHVALLMHVDAVYGETFAVDDCWRCLTLESIAKAAAKRWPGRRIDFVLYPLAGWRASI